jgi:class 3 adenylate cyclase
MDSNNRQLLAIFSADVKDYTIMMAEDDNATFKTLIAHRQIISDLVEKNHGRVVDRPGDNLLAEFRSVVNALMCGIEMQDALHQFNFNRPMNRRMEWRVGINLGDVIADEGGIFGDGVNLAARIQGLAEPGGICISNSVFVQVHGKLDFIVEDMGYHSLKNIAVPVQVYRVLRGPRQDPNGPLPSNPPEVFRKKINIKLKLIVVLRSMLENVSAALLAEEYNTSPSSVYRWRKELMGRGIADWDRRKQKAVLDYLIGQKVWPPKGRSREKAVRLLGQLME